MKHQLKANFIFIFFFIIIRPVSAQWVTLPDPNFVAWLNSNGYAAALNGNDLDTTHSLVTTATSIQCPYANINDLDGIQYFDNLVFLKCAHNSLVTLPGLPSGLITLQCGFNSLTSLPDLPLGLTTLECEFNSIFSLPNLPSGLTYLDCMGNGSLITLPSIPSTLTHLICRANTMSVLPALPNTLNHLDCAENPLYNISSFPSQLSYLDCSYNNLSSLPSLPPGLYELYCRGNSLTSLPTLPSVLWWLDCSYNPGITSLPALPASLHYLGCYHNQISILPVLPPQLETLSCDHNLLTELPSIPSTLLGLECNNNQIDSLPVLPDSMNYVECSNNQLVHIANIPGYTFFAANANQLTSLPNLPDSLNMLEVSNNPGLSCLPLLTKMNLLEFVNTGIQCLPNYGNVISSDPPFSSVPLCDIFNINNCIFSYTLGGKVYADSNANCINEPQESIYPGFKLKLFQNGNLVQQQYSSNMGFYTFDTAIDTFDVTVDTADVPYQVGCPASGSYTVNLSPVDTVELGLDFGVQCKSGFDVGVIRTINAHGSFFPGDSVQLNCIAGDMGSIFNLNCTSGITGTVTITFSGPVQYGGAVPGSLTPVFTPNTLTYTVSDYGLLNEEEAFRFFLITDTTAQSGQSVCITINVTATGTDLYPSNNNHTQCYILMNSYDPNSKVVSPVDTIYPFTEWLNYTVYFQNTGTAPAQHIVIADTLNNNLDVSSFTFLGSDHSCFVNVTGDIVRFTFPNINLPDSTSNEPGSHGYVQYKIKPDVGLPIGSTIENTAAIYFDFNPPILTNTTLNTVATPTGIAEYQNVTFYAYPNPANNFINIRAAKEGIYNVTMADITGRVIFKKQYSGIEFTIDVSEFSDGMYFLSMQNGTRQSTIKIIVK